MGTTYLGQIAVGEQFPLFDGVIDLSELRSAREDLMRHTQAKNTKRGYAVSWGVFERWCNDSGRQALPASADTVSLFISWGIEKRQPSYKLNNLKHICAAIRNKHRALDLDHPITALVRGTLAGAARKYDQESGAKEALTPEQLRAAIASLGDLPIDRRNRALLLVGFTTGWRSAELAGLYLREVRFFPKFMRFELRRSKTDQEGKGREVKIPRIPGGPLCPVAALEAWIRARGADPGPLFLPFRGSCQTPEQHAIHPDLICHVVKRCLRSIGVAPEAYGSHSLRAGMVTAATENGADPICIRERTGHKRLDTLADYVRSPGGFGRDPLAGVLESQATITHIP
jgi:integrase